MRCVSSRITKEWEAPDSRLVVDGGQNGSTCPEEVGGESRSWLCLVRRGG